MDIFMDKLAQRATAQEIIKANTAADLEELNRLKNQVGEYNECLARLQKLLEDSSGKLEGMKAEDGEVRRLVQDGLERMKALRKMMDDFRQDQKWAAEQMESLDKKVVSGIEHSVKALEDKVDRLDGLAEGRLTESQLTEKLGVLEENVHKECVKVYRNVQAVVTEESGRQGEALAETKKEISEVRGRIGAVLGFSVAAMVLSLAGVVLQILVRLGVVPF